MILREPIGELIGFIFVDQFFNDHSAWCLEPIPLVGAALGPA